MRSLGKFYCSRGKSPKARLLIAATIFAFALAFVPQSRVYADAAGATGGAGGGAGGGHSSNGWGWYNYSVNGDPQPAGFRWSGNWQSVSALCSSEGADRVITFINLKVNITGASRPSHGTDASKGVVYDYETIYHSPRQYSGYNGGAGGNWLQTSTAKTLFDSIDVDKSVFIWGTNVAWFCYDATPLDFSLTPSISTNPSDAVEAGTKITVSPVVINGGTTTSSSVTYELNSFLVAPGNDVPRINSAGYYDSDTAPCGFYIGSGVSKCDLATFTGGGGSIATFSYPVGTHKYNPDREDVADDLAVGTKVCYTHSVKRRSDAANQWRHSNPACITIGIKPKVQILGSDLLVGRTFMGLTAATGAGNIQTSTSSRTVGSTIKTLGSWVEYGVQASGRIVGIGSGSAYGGSGLADDTTCKAKPLTFTNGTNSKCAYNAKFGGYQANQNISDVGSSFPITNSTASLRPNRSVNLSGLRGLYTATGNVTVKGGAINSGQWVVLNVPNSTVTITGDINYTNANLNSAGDIPQVVIIAKNINIQSGVDNVDAWLIAKGSTTADGIINTCSTSGANDYKKLSPCDKKLTVNGPVMANKVYLRRTSNSSTGVPAEVFNLRPDAYMWAYARSVGGARVQTVYSTELPPRL